MTSSDRGSDPNSGHSPGVESPFRTVSETEYSRRDRYAEAFRTELITPLEVLLSDYRGVFGLATVLAYVLAATVGVWFITPPKGGGPILLTPFQGGLSAITESGGWIDFTMAAPWIELRYPLGTNRYGTDLVSLLVHATPDMLKMILGGAVFSISMAVIVGTLSGYEGGPIDSVLMMLSDAVLAIPGLPLIIVLGAIIRPDNPFVVGLIIGLPRWAGLARALRSEVLSLREESFVEASKINGLSTPTILRRELIPNLMPYITINFVNAARGVIFASVALYFLDILPTTGLNWGVMMNRAYTSTGALYSLETAHWLIFPMVAIVWLSFGLIMLGQAADRIFNPRLKARHTDTRHAED